MQGQTNNHRTIIVGAGHCGLSMAHQLGKSGEDLIVLDSGPAPGSSWRSRWDSLQLFTPAAHDGLPGRRFPARRSVLPAAGAVADYLESYAEAFGMPIHSSTTVTGMDIGAAGGFTVHTTDGIFTADRVVVATGVHQAPKIPAFAARVSAATTQLHSSGYRNPQMLPEGPVAVVGFGTSGAQIACELAASRQVTLCGKPTAHVPDALIHFAPALYWLLVHRILTRRTPAGRKVAKGFLAHGAPLIGLTADDVDSAGVIRAGKIAEVRDGVMVAQDGAVIEASTIIWATGYRPDFSWIHGLEVDEAGYPFHHRGISTRVPGLGFLGLPFQYGLTSGIIGGAGRDARHLARRMPHHGATASPHASEHGANELAPDRD
ncbi:NAD(P)/FAD-dependent oxidoreductase [Paeniglutamicibacter psychrophenolicus]|uniref:Flavoprotein involved in K+ transport n=1 Tax=Paeniglutamicibacter psychrophenolicus TaxID=257454 RepID=A0ABS4WFM1_9MICC|nr:NAD(P)/FAD-dependent oxidoreductase [Paeniglutamicibacter psychrophenolicus]MBP2374997.1 putative flavoprotein involved in K+ transport [Paeniglutamicibacter psychrophenolicus]